MKPKIATFGAGVKGYALGHWLGRQPLVLSFWVNLALLRAAILYVQDFTHLTAIADPYAGAVAVILFSIAAHGIVYTWQVVGVVRACDQYQSSYGSTTLVWAAHFGIVISLIFTLVSVFTSFQNYFAEPDKELLSLEWERERASKYALTLSDDNSYIHLSGSFELGITKNLRALLHENPNVKGIVLESPGGNVYESRSVAKLVHDRGLDSYVYETCSSACTTAFIAGARRALGPDGKLGFHQYGLEANYQVPLVDIAGEQNTDRKFYGSQGIKDEFLDRIFASMPTDLWFPSAEELLDAGVVHRIDAKLH